MDACNDDVFFEFEQYTKNNDITLFRISSLTRSGTKELIDYVSDIVKKHKVENEEAESDIEKQL